MYGYVRPLTPDEIYHHGILGQKWGKRNGPPYPLGAGDNSASERKAGWKKSLDGSKDKEYNKSTNGEHKGLTDKQKKAIEVGAAVVASSLAVCGTIYLAKSGRLDKLVDLGKNHLVYGGLNRGEKSLDKIFSNLPKGLSEEQRIARINPMYHTKAPSFTHNCGNCAIANELSMRGKDVQAGLNPMGMDISHFGQYFNGIHKNTFANLDDFINYEQLKNTDNKVDRAKKCYSMISKGLKDKYPNGSRGAIFVNLNYDDRYSGHVISFNIENDIVKIIDAQKPSKNRVGSVLSHIDYLPNKNNIVTMRLDDLDINTNSIEEVVGKYGKSEVISKLKLPLFDGRITRGNGFEMRKPRKKI